VAAWVLGRGSLPASRPLRSVALPDVLGAVMVMAAVVGISFGISQGRPWGWDHPAVLVAFAAAVALVPLFVWRCNRHPSPVLPVGLFRRRSFAGANAAAFMLGAATGGVSLANVLFLRDVWGYSLVIAGLGALPSSLCAMSVARLVGVLGTRFGELAVGVPGAVCIAASMTWLRTATHGEPNYWFGYLPGAVLLGVGIAASLPMIATAVVRGIGPDQLSLVSASNRTFLQLGNAVGVAVVVAVLGSGAALDEFHTAWTVLGVPAVGCALGLVVAGRTARWPHPAPAVPAPEPR